MALIEISAADQLQIQRLKKRKLILRDRIDRIEDSLTPESSPDPAVRAAASRKPVGVEGGRHALELRPASRAL